MSKQSQSMPVRKLCDLFANVVDVVFTEDAVHRANGNGDFSNSQWQGALFIHRHQDCSIRDLAQGLSISHPAAVKLVERLVRKGLVDRSTCQKDRRAVELRMSSWGLECIQKVREISSSSFQRILKSMDPEDCAALMRGLLAFLTATFDNPDIIDRACLYCGTEHLSQCPAAQAQERMTGCPRTSY